MVTSGLIILGCLLLAAALILALGPILKIFLVVGLLIAAYKYVRNKIRR